MPCKDVRWLATLSMLFVVACGKEITDEQYAKFPKLFHLDDYQECLGAEDGLYCLGTFHITPIKENDPTYELMKEYSRDASNYNRTLLHRGFCVSSRCPQSSTLNSSARFERCIAQYAKSLSLRSKLTELNYCRTEAQERALESSSASVETPHVVFIVLILVLTLLNVAGTLYDIIKKDDKKNRLLTSWSTISSWRILVGSNSDTDQDFAAKASVGVFRVIMLSFVILVHTCWIFNQLYIDRAELPEHLINHWLFQLLRNSTSTMQMFFLLSSFLLGHNLLNYRQQLTFKILPKLIIKRISRIMPVYLLGIGFAATWWPLMKTGPLWVPTVVAESEVCRRKFWAHLFFLNNLIMPDQHCVLPTWSLAVDMQLYVLGCTVMVSLARFRRLAQRLLAVAFLTSIVVTTWMAYIHHWRPLLFISGSETLRTAFRQESSFHQFYISPLGSLPALFAGLFLAHLQQRLQETGFDLANRKWVIFTQALSILALVSWIASGRYLQGSASRVVSTVHIAMERTVVILISSFLIISIYYASGRNNISLTPIWARVFYLLGRCSLATLMLHMIVNLTITASTQRLISYTLLDLIADAIPTILISYLVAIPITLCVEIPFNKLYSAIFGVNEYNFKQE